jgi:hypothetical protein
MPADQFSPSPSIESSGFFVSMGGFDAPGSLFGYHGLC